MSGLWQRLAFRWLARRETVRVADCVHFGAFRYGRGELNPYENYVTGLARGEPVAKLRERFTAFLCEYRPVDFGEALGVRLEQAHGLWDYPWRRGAPDTRRAGKEGWCEEPADVPDLLTHFSERGILRSRIEEEFRWLEATWASVREHGYRPRRFAGHLTARKLVARDGERRFLIYDGNHRLSAVSALGQDEVTVRCAAVMTVRETALARWRGVASRRWTADDARRIFRAYFEGNRAPRTSGSRAEPREDEA